MKRTFFSLLFSIFGFLLFSSPAYAVPFNNPAANGAANAVLFQDKKTLEYQCKCDKSGESGGFQCIATGGADSEPTSTGCRGKLLCFNDQNTEVMMNGKLKGNRISGITCEKKGFTGATDPPPLPPCEKYDGKGGCQSVVTSIGSLSTSPGGFIQKIFALLLSLSGGVAVLLIMRAGYQLITSQGKPETIQQGRDQLIAAIVGLLFLIFSFVLLQTIGIDILRLDTVK